jgi:site-specific DNA-methyltransferase (adenine-specific)
VTWQVEHVADSFAWIAKLPDACVDVVITDPPYSKHVHENMSSGTAMKKQVEGGSGGVGGKGGGIPRITLPFGNLQQYDFAQDLPRIARRWAIAFCAVEDFGAYRDAVGQDQYARSGIWYKPNSMGQLTGDRPANVCEGLAIMHRPAKGLLGRRKEWNGNGSFAYWSSEDDSGHYQLNGTRGEKGRHPNQKPLALCLELVAKFTQPGEFVLDPFAGSARIGEACVLLGRNYLGLDNDKAWVEKARERLKAAEEKPALVDTDCLRLCAAPKRTT